jgi:hypothetical protein
MPNEPPYKLKRLYPRRRISLPCWVSWRNEHQVLGKTFDVSYSGVGIVLPEVVNLNGLETSIMIPEGIRLWGHPVYRREETDGGYRVGYTIERIERGEERWREVCYIPQW